MKPIDYILNTDIGYTPYEAWAMLNWNGILVPRYSISSKGRLYDHSNELFVRYSIDKDGYFMASINVFGVFKKIRVHRWELMSFFPNPNFKNLQCNHIDGNKQNLDIINLEWITPIGNTRHGWDTGLNNNIGVNNGNGKYDDLTIHEICRLIDLGLSNCMICDYFHIFDKVERMRFNAVISGTRHGKVHRNISINYNFMKGASVHNRYPTDIAEELCKFLSDGNQYTYRELMNHFNIPNEERKNFKVFIDDLVDKRTYKAISDKYNNLIKPKKVRDDNDLMR